jgi:hypothetical protein
VGQARSARDREILRDASDCPVAAAESSASRSEVTGNWWPASR